MIKKWKTIKEVDISPSKWFPLMKQAVVLPNGKVIDDYYVSPQGNIVMVLPLTKKNEIVLVKQYKHGLGRILVELPAGFQQPGKTLKESALAELEEETGIKANSSNLRFVCKFSSNPTKTSSIVYCYLGRNLTFNSEQRLDPTENIEILKVSPRQCLRMVKNGEIWASESAACIALASLKYPGIFGRED